MSTDIATTAVTDLALPEKPVGQLIPPESVIQRLQFLANAIVKSRMPLPKGCSTPEAVFARLLLGMEYGIPIMSALYDLYLIEGKPSIPAMLQVALVRRRNAGIIDVALSTNERASVRVHRNDWPESRWEIVEWTIEDARHSDLLQEDRPGHVRKDNWRNYPRAMLVSRATSEACRTYFQDVFLGMPYTPDEIGADTDEQGRPLLEADFENVKPPWETDQSATQEQETTQNGVGGTPNIPLVAAPNGVPPLFDKQYQMIGQSQLAGLAQTIKASGITEQQWRMHLSSYGIAVTSAKQLSSAQCDQAMMWLSSFSECQKLRRICQIDDASWDAALDRRGVTNEAKLNRQQLDEICEKLSPFGGMPNSAGG